MGIQGSILILLAPRKIYIYIYIYKFVRIRILVEEFYRQCNAVAHSLARRAILSPCLQVWMEDVPPELADVFLADLQAIE